MNRHRLVQEATVRSASTEERERVENVVSNAQEQLLRAKGQVARLQQGEPVSNTLSPEARASQHVFLNNGQQWPRTLFHHTHRRGGSEALCGDACDHHSSLDPVFACRTESICLLLNSDTRSNCVGSYQSMQ